MFINDLLQVVKPSYKVYSDELSWILREPDGRRQLQEYLDALDRWSQKRELPVSYEKCVHTQVGRQRKRDTQLLLSRVCVTDNP